MSLTLSPRLPEGDQNGLGPQLPGLLDDPRAVHVAVVLYKVRRITINPETDDRGAQVYILAIEPITPTADAAEMKRLLRRAAERRTGRQELPLDLERALEQVDTTDPADRRHDEEPPTP